jgi:hypothetical protein
LPFLTSAMTARDPVVGPDQHLLRCWLSIAA